VTRSIDTVLQQEQGKHEQGQTYVLTEGMENYVDDDSISPTEQGFMRGYLGA